MISFKFGISHKSCLGIDIGTSAIKVVELSSHGERVELKKYGEISLETVRKYSFRDFEKTTTLFSPKDIAKLISSILKETKITERKVIFSIPDFSSFFTSFQIPQMTKEEINQAVRYEARHHIPLPLAEVTLDWSIIEGKMGEKESPLKILLVAVPNDIINQYQQTATLANLKLIALETEVFGLLRSLIKKDDKDSTVILDIGGRSTTINIVDNGKLLSSHSFDIAGNEFTHVLAKSLEVDSEKAENLKRKYGLKTPDQEEKTASMITSRVRDIIVPLVDLIALELEKISINFFQAQKKELKKIILAGGSALLPGLKEYFQKTSKAQVEIANAFSNIIFPPILEKVLKHMGPSYAIAIGMALRGLE